MLTFLQCIPDNYDPGNLMPPEEDDDIGVFLDDEVSNENAIAQRQHALMEQFRACTVNALQHFIPFCSKKQLPSHVCICYAKQGHLCQLMRTSWIGI